jgi:hypothetical protein
MAPRATTRGWLLGVADSGGAWVQVASLAFCAVIVTGCTGSNSAAAPATRVSPLAPTVRTASFDPSAGPVSPCDPQEISIGVDELGATGSAVIGADLGSHRGTCHLDTQITATLEDSGQHPLRVAGSPSTVHFVGNVPSRVSFVNWVWSNWCGSPERDGARVRLELANGAAYLDARLALTARCDDASKLSSLRHQPF